MTRLEAAKKTGLIVVLAWALGWALDRWPEPTIATLSVASIYSTIRRQAETEGEAIANVG